MKEIPKMDEIPSENQFAYHITDKRNKRSILSNGISASVVNSDWDEVNYYLEKVAEEENINTVIEDRRKCVFCYARDVDAIDGLGVDQNIVFVIDLSQLSASKYRGNYHTVTQIYQKLRNKKLSSIDKIIESRSIDKESRECYELAVEYWDSLSKISNQTSKGGEILVDGDIPLEAIKGYVENNSY